MGTRIKLNHGGMADLLKSAGVRTTLTSHANSVLSAAQASAPVASGDYRASLHLVQATTDRAVVRVASDVDYAMVVEANTGNLARALDHA